MAFGFAAKEESALNFSYFSLPHLTKCKKHQYSNVLQNFPKFSIEKQIVFLPCFMFPCLVFQNFLAGLPEIGAKMNIDTHTKSGPTAAAPAQSGGKTSADANADASADAIIQRE